MRFLAHGHSSTIYTLDDTHHEQACSPRRRAAAPPKACRRQPSVSSASYGHTQPHNTLVYTQHRHTHPHTLKDRGLSLNRRPFLKRGISLNQGFLEIDLKRKIFLPRKINLNLKNSFTGKTLCLNVSPILLSYSLTSLHLTSLHLTSLHLTSLHLTSLHLTMPCTLTLTLTLYLRRPRVFDRGPPRATPHNA